MSSTPTATGFARCSFAAPASCRLRVSPSPRRDESSSRLASTNFSPDQMLLTLSPTRTSGQWNDAGGADLSIACQKRDLVDHAGRGDEFVGRIPFEVEPRGLKADGEVQWPDMET